jgi:hypothetical protein
MSMKLIWTGWVMWVVSQSFSVTEVLAKIGAILMCIGLILYLTGK